METTTEPTPPDVTGVPSSSDWFASFYAQHPPQVGKAIWGWEPDRSQFRKQDDLASAYVIAEVAPATDGQIVLYAKHGEKWEANPWSSRPVLRRLLNMCGGAVHHANSDSAKNPA